MNTTSRAPASRRMPPEERERSIVEGAVELALANGIDALTVRAIAAHVGVTPALVAHYRPVMDSLVAEVFGAIVAAERNEVLDDFSPAGGLRASLQRLVESLLDGSRDDVALIWVQAWSLGVRNALLGERVRAEMDLWQSRLEEVIAGAASEDPDDSADPAFAAWMLLAMVDGMSAHSLVKWAPHDRADLARRTVSAVIDRPSSTPISEERP
ncbi:TetR/AcrR family transcriptional regulator [Microbacterium sp. W4I20]|uniref:TetR/AcrR family transcriptional regulator n=1 Tax=Microbacterium sp. W4I20 TaxID=3042262 RepID=UPI00277FF3A1|nr:TetR/AcrR family transcriptional regulator [Microbacterium sp. W4I20]MDQ0728358.1 AcrR family transcriptional regulator [Microbacterium sp. W4I20]